MKTWRSLIVCAIFLSSAALTAEPARNAGSKEFEEAFRRSNAGMPADAAASAEKGWGLVRAAGLADSGFLDGVFTAYGIFLGLAQDLRAESIYTEAESLCGAPELQILGLRLQYMHADHLIRRSQHVRAEALLRSSLAIENRSARKSSLYVAFLQSLAFVREQEGELEDAEGLCRLTLNYPRPDLSGIKIQRFQSGPGQRLPFIGEPRASLAAFYSDHGRLTEAEAIYREQLAQPWLQFEDRLADMGQLASFLSVHGSKTGALEIEEQILGLLQVQALTTPGLSDRLMNERYTLAKFEVAAGRSADAKALLEAELEGAQQLHGKQSAEYAHAINNLFENRRDGVFHHGDAEMALALNRRALEHATGFVPLEELQQIIGKHREEILRERKSSGTSK